MRLKRLYVLAAALLFAGVARAEGVPEAIRTKGEVLAAAENPSILCEYEEDAGALALFNRAVVRETAGKMAVQAAFAEAEEGGLLPGLSGGQYDLALGVNPPAGEEEDFLVTEPFAYSRTVLLVRGDNEAVTDFAGLSGARVAVTGAAEQLPEGLPQDVTAVPAETAEEALELVVSGRADACLWDELSFLAYLDGHPLADLRVAAKVEEAFPVCFLVSADRADLAACVNAALAELRAEGTLAELSVETLGDDVTAAPAAGPETEAETPAA